MQYFPQTPLYLQILEWENALSYAIQTTSPLQFADQSLADIYQEAYLSLLTGACTWLRREQLFQKILNAYPNQLAQIKQRYEIDQIDFQKSSIQLIFKGEMITCDFDHLLGLKSWGIDFISLNADLQSQLESKLSQKHAAHFDAYLIKQIKQIPKIASQLKGTWQFTEIFNHQVQDQLRLSHHFEKLIFDLFDHLSGYKSKWPTLEQDVLESCDLIVERKQPFFKYQIQISLDPTLAQFQRKQDSLKRMRVPSVHKKLITPYSLIEQATAVQCDRLNLQSKTKQGQAYEVHQRIVMAIKEAHLHPLGAFARLEETMIEMIIKPFSVEP